VDARRFVGFVIWRRLSTLLVGGAVRFDRFLVGVDGSNNSVAAVAWVAALAARTGGEVVAVHALGLLERSETDELVPALPHREEIRQRFEGVWCAPLEDATVPFRALLLDGSPVSVILAAADGEDVDLIVLGSRGLGGFAEELGSTSTQVAQRSHRPVTIVPTSS
jgi:nucleotide-binding universal stress UspA family protein